MNKAEKNLIDMAKEYDIKIIGKYIGATENIEIIANCGHRISRTPQVIKRGLKRAGQINCPGCRYSKSKEDRKHSPDSVMSILDENTFKVISVEYINTDFPMDFICDCGNDFTRSFYQARKSIEKYSKNICKDCMQKLRPPPNKLSVKKIQNTCSKYGARLLSTEYLGNKKPISLIGSCGHRFDRNWGRISHSISLYGKILCPHCGIRQEQKIKKVSKGETEVADYIRSLGFDVVLNKRPTWARGKEIDIQVTGTSLAIEYNGEYWHSEEMGTGKNYHVSKENDARAANINLLQIFETEWIFKRDIIESMIAAKLGVSNKIYARKTVVKKISASTARDFLSRTHRQGGEGATNNSYGLFYNDRLVSCATFRKPRFTNGFDMELYRFSSELGTSITGGFQKLLSAFNKSNNYPSLLSYADLRYTDLNNNIYKKSGFRLERVSPPSYYYFKQNRPLLNRVSYQKHKLANKLDIFDGSRTEHENMRDNNFKRVWDCGAAVYSINKI